MSGSVRLIAGPLLALFSAGLINFGFLLQHRGLNGHSGGMGTAWRSRTWLLGQACGWSGFALQIVAVAIAPLALVQAFAAGGLALSVPLAARLFGHRVSSRQRVAVILIAAGLAALPIAASTAPDRLLGGRLAVCAVVAAVAACVAVSIVGGRWRAIAAGIFYGTADAAIKAVAVGWHARGPWSAWTILAVAATFAGFLAFQAALRRGGAVGAISLMNASTSLLALGCGLVAFGESLGGGISAVTAHVLAIAVVLCCVPSLAAAQQELAQ